MFYYPQSDEDIGKKKDGEEAKRDKYSAMATGINITYFENMVMIIHCHIYFIIPHFIIPIQIRLISIFIPAMA